MYLVSSIIISGCTEFSVNQSIENPYFTPSAKKHEATVGPARIILSGTRTWSAYFACGRYPSLAAANSLPDRVSKCSGQACVTVLVLTIKTNNT
jgi:hypothetical protein